MVWTNDLIFDFLHLYKNEPMLWNTSTPEHKNRNDAYDAWSRIKNKLRAGTIPIKELKKKRDCLMSTYRRQRTKVSESMKIGSGAEVYKPEWPFYTVMANFLDDIYKPKKSQSSEVEGAESTPKPKKGKSIVFASVKQACIDLVKKHGHSVSLIDEEAFRTLIQLMPMTMKEKARITSEYIQKCVDSTGEEDDADMSYQEERDASDNDDETTTDRVITIKGEIEEVQCNCNARVSEESNKFHEVGCPAAARQPYWNYFEVTTDEATCHICNLTLNWTNITKLKEHLLEKHPTAEFVDDGEEFVRGPASDVWSHEDTEEVYLEDDFDLDPLPTPSAKKRKRTSERLKSRDDRTLGEEDKLRQERVRAERLRTMRDERHGLSEASRKVIELAPDRFKSLDSFGQYVAELMKLIPKEKCLKYQVQIVQRLLQEQAAAG